VALTGLVSWFVLAACSPDAPHGSAGDSASSAGTGVSVGGTPAAGSGGSTSAATGGMPSLGGSAGTVADAGGGPTETWGPASPGCRAYAEAECDWLARCANDEEYREHCEAGIDTACAWYALPGVGVTEDDLLGAAAEVMEAGCDRSTSPEFPNGTLEEGAPCATWLQCASGYCDNAGQGCGECAPSPRREIGESCESAATYCAFSECIEGVCTKAREEGETCDEVRACSLASREDGQLACVEGTCTAIGRAGDPCVDGEWCGGGNACTLEELCVTVELVELGEVCGTFDDRVSACREGGCATTGEGQAHCLEFAGLGENCLQVPGYRRCKGVLHCDIDDICRYYETAGPPACSG
jgi:hypothetical protein